MNCAEIGKYFRYCDKVIDRSEFRVDQEVVDGVQESGSYFGLNCASSDECKISI